MSSLLLGIDIGTTSVSVVVIDESGRLEASVTLAHGAAVAGLPSGYAEQCPEFIWQAVVTALRQVTQAIQGRDVAAIGMTGQMHSTLFLDKDGEPCSNIITWQDKRAVVNQTDAVSLFERLLSRVPEESMKPTGCRLAPGYLGTTLFVARQLNGVPSSARRVTFVADWIAARLCEQIPVTDRSHAASSGLYDLQRDSWSPALLDAAEIDVAWLPEVKVSGAVIGTVSTTVAAATGLSVGTRVCNALGDNQAAVLSSLSNDDGALLINIGTGGQIVWRIPAFRRIDGLDTRYLPGSSSRAGTANDHQFMLVGAGLCGGDAFAWINRTTRQWLHAFGVEMSEEEVWLRLTQQMQELPGHPSSVTCEPFFGGTRPEPNRRATFADVGTLNFTPANVARSILHGIAEAMQSVYASAVGARPEPLTQIAMSGNGSRQNPMLVEAVQKRFGVPAFVAPCQEEAATGAVMLAGVRVGIWDDLESAQQTIHQKSRQEIET